jgi:hypothetical protein
MFNAARIRECIISAAVTDAELPVTVANDVAFHLTDWMQDLESFVSFCQSPDKYNPAQVNAILLAFLIHAPNHLAAAAKLYADIPVTDVFGVGAVDVPGGGDA